MEKYLESCIKKIHFFQKRNNWRQDIEKKEYVIAVIKNCIVVCGLAFLFYDRWWSALFLFPIWLVFLYLWEKDIEQKKEQQFCSQFKDAIQTLASALAAGYSVENAMRATEKDLRQLYPEKARIRKEFLVMVHQLDMNFSTDRIWTEFANRIQQEDVDDFVTVFSISKKAGGDSITIIRNAIKMICDKLEVREEIDVMIASKKYEFRVMTFVPLGIIFYMRMSFPEFLDILYGNVLGICLMTICLLLYGSAYLLGKKVIAIEV